MKRTSILMVMQAAGLEGESFNIFRRREEGAST